MCYITIFYTLYHILNIVFTHDTIIHYITTTYGSYRMMPKSIKHQNIVYNERRDRLVKNSA